MADVLKRIRKMIELSKNNPSPEEAASAAAMAQDLMFKYQIGEADLETGDSKREPEEVVQEGLASGDTRKRGRNVWKACLAYAVAKGFGCEMYNERDKDGNPAFQVYGLKSAVQTVSYMYGYLVLEIDRQCEEAWKAAGREEDSFANRAKARSWRNSFRQGAVNAIRLRLEAQRAQHVQEVSKRVAAEKAAGSRSTAMALFKSDEERVQDGWKVESKRLHLRAGRSVSYINKKDAYDRGRDAGNNMSLGGGRGLGGSKQRIEE